MAAGLSTRRNLLPKSLPSVSVQEPPEHHLISVGLVRSIGIFALSMAGHSSLPSFRNRSEGHKREGQRNGERGGIMWTPSLT